ncbi:uncharacterized protein LOC121425133 [Lytechinus variegatus]|uniref:uncharacterized protein LOC121425133 n=1 Tax=Lytechinus variegatus TaxID=7654 RepID=UPI001BB20AB7|nr:uncharacterized protein LOC121425133 [Lytechinus variegatus]
MGMTSTYSPEEFVGLTTIASSPCENNNLPPPAAFLSSTSSSSSSSSQQWSIMITPTSSPTKEMEGVIKEPRKVDEVINDNACSYCSDDDHHDDINDDDSDADTMTERGADRFVLDPCNELDLEQIEKY